MNQHQSKVNNHLNLMATGLFGHGAGLNEYRKLRSHASEFSVEH